MSGLSRVVREFSLHDVLIERLYWVENVLESIEIARFIFRKQIDQPVKEGYLMTEMSRSSDLDFMNIVVVTSSLITKILEIMDPNQEIENLYNSSNGVVTLGSATGRAVRDAQGGYYKIYPKGVIVWSAAHGARVVYSDPEPFLSSWFQSGLCGQAGYPTEAMVTNPDRTGKRQRFENGHIYWHPELPYRRASFIRDGAIWDKWAAQRWEQGPLGYPLSNEITRATTIENLSVVSQSFSGGSIFVYKNNSTSEQVCLAFDNEGCTINGGQYKLTLERVRCIRESNGRGSDELGLSLVVTPTCAETTIHRWFHGDMDSGESRSPNLTLYDGRLPAGMSVSLIGLEKDGRRAFKSQRNVFEQTMRRTDDELDVDRFLDVSRGVVGGSAALGAIIGTIVAGGGFSLVPAAGGAGVTIVFTGGTAVGGVIGAAVAAVVLISVFLGLDWRSPELMMLDRSIYVGESISGLFLNSNMELPTVNYTIDRLSVSIEFERIDENRVREIRRYINPAERSDYELHFIHELRS